MQKLNVLFISIVFFSACEGIFFEDDLESTAPRDNFEYLWNECKEKYAYFELKDVDWDNVKEEYQSKLYPGMSNDSLFNVLGGMLTELKDDHSNLISDFNISSYGIKYSSQDNFDWRIIVDNYITQDYYTSGPFAHNFIANRELAYVRLASFPGTLKAEHLDFILDRYKNTRGMILDLRENGGGSIAEVFTLLSRFIESNTLVFFSKIKTGPEPNSFSDPEPVHVQAYDGLKYNNKLIILTDRGTYSSGSLFSLATKALPDVQLLGDTTGGGLGMPNGGQLPNGWTYRFSVSQTLDLDQSPDFENGVPPDILVLFNWNDLSKDEILERAILELQ